MQGNTFVTFAAGCIKRVIADRMMSGDGVPGSSRQIRIIHINNSVFASGHPWPGSCSHKFSQAVSS